MDKYCCVQLAAIKSESEHVVMCFNFVLAVTILWLFQIGHHKDMDNNKFQFLHQIPCPRFLFHHETLSLCTKIKVNK